MAERRGRHFSATSLEDRSEGAPTTVGTPDHMESYGHGVRMTTPIYGGAAAVYASVPVRPASHLYVGNGDMNGLTRQGMLSDVSPLVDIDEPDIPASGIPQAGNMPLVKDISRSESANGRTNRLIDGLVPRIEQGSEADDIVSQCASGEQKTVLRPSSRDAANSETESQSPTADPKECEADTKTNPTDAVSAPSARVQVYFPGRTRVETSSPHVGSEHPMRHNAGTAAVAIGAVTVGIIALGIGRHMISRVE